MDTQIYKKYSNYIIDNLYQLVNSYIDIGKYQPTFKETNLHLLSKLHNKCFNISHDDLISIMIYIDRLTQKSPTLFINIVNIDYILLVIVMLYIKMYDDHWYINSSYAQWTGLDLKIINQTEIDILTHISLFIKDKDYSNKKADVMKLNRML